jgi:predicted dehydrogenase
MDQAKVGVVGCGAISARYLENLTRRFRFCVDVVACADLIPERAQARAAEHGVPRACSVDDLLADPAIELVVNLTVPAAHFEVSMAALEGGKHVYSEKPLAVTREEGRLLLAKARSMGLRIGGAPDTFLGAGLQTCRKLVDDGWIGRPVAASGRTILGVQVERYHKAGVGPVFDIGPYYLTALVFLLGPVLRATGSAQTPFPQKAITDPLSPGYGHTFAVETPTSVCGVLDMAGGCVATLTATCDVPGYDPRLEIYGTDGILIANDPNAFGGPVCIRRAGVTREVPLTHGYAENSRGLGVADMVCAIRAGRPHRASGELMYHVLDVAHAMHDASKEGRHQEIQSTTGRPQPFRPGLQADVFGDTTCADC